MLALCPLFSSQVRGGQQTPQQKCQLLKDDKFTLVEYFLVKEEGQEAANLISLLMTDMDVEEAAKLSFGAFLQRKCDYGKPGQISLPRLPDLLEDFKLEEGGINAYASVEEIKCKMDTTDAGGVFYMARECPSLTKFAPLLFPKKILSLAPNEQDLKKGGAAMEAKRQMLDHLEVLAANEPWKLGFAEVKRARGLWSR
jgi:hypothetical protein